ncbi:helix-turn-helix domain-containing protein [Fibrivirga algicola]|uniref:AraC family transcriptional regulator n=1 Tax=Fibrivirga algicola TaxID=2950420 RepID=A0ABX0QP46_9BACT|nr:helix-turn-helix domain-containing protein [Fibrivirga algicola]NID13026.1 AraC family transcriptional regulator [Fibrivirga algicola]
MTFYFSAYSTPLLFGFVQGWVYAILLWIRGYREERLSDKLLGGVLVGLCFEIWVYMLGFGGIEILWQQLEFFPRDVGYLLGPLIYFYLKSQFDATFRFRLRDGWHALPFILHWVYHVTVFAQGPAFVQQWETNVHNPLQLGNIEFVVLIVQQYVYLYLSFQLYRGYRRWIKHQFSETDTISFRWYRNFLVALIVTATISLTVTLVDMWLDLSFWQDWWGNLAGVVLIYYVSIEGYAQTQLARKLVFKPELAGSDPVIPEGNVPALIEGNGSESTGQANVPTQSADQAKVPAILPDLPERLSTLLDFMNSEKPYLEPDLALPDLARRMHTNPVLLSQVINAGAGKNFNDFVNEYRVDEFKRQVRDPANAHLSFLGLALDCGFNSKATFNRAFKKFTGTSPKEFTA